MQVQVHRLREVLALLGPAIPKKSTLPVLTNVLLQKGRAMATDLDVAVAVELPEAKGSCLLPYREVSELLKRVPGAQAATLEHTGKKLQMAWEGGKAAYEVPQPEDFPPFPQVEPEIEGSVDGDSLVQTLLTVEGYCATEQSRPVLSGVWLTLGEPLEVAAGDGFRMAWKALRGFPLPEGIARQVVVPAQAVRVLDHLWQKAPKTPLFQRKASVAQMAAASRPLSLALGVKKLQARFGAVTLVASLIEGTPPDYRRLIPTDAPHKVKVISGDMERAVRQVQGAANAVRLIWSSDTLKVSARSDDQEAEVSLAVTSEGGDGRIALNPGYLLDYLKGKEGMVEMGVTEDASPILLRHGSSPTVLLMPMAVTW